MHKNTIVFWSYYRNGILSGWSKFRNFRQQVQKVFFCLFVCRNCSLPIYCKLVILFWQVSPVWRTQNQIFFTSHSGIITIAFWYIFSICDYYKIFSAQKSEKSRLSGLNCGLILADQATANHSQNIHECRPQANYISVRYTLAIRPIFEYVLRSDL